MTSTASAPGEGADRIVRVLLTRDDADKLHQWLDAAMEKKPPKPARERGLRIMWALAAALVNEEMDRS